MEQWKAGASARKYVTHCEQPLRSLIAAVDRERRRHPRKAIDANEHYLSISKMLLLPNLQENLQLSAEDKSVVDKIKELAETSKGQQLDRKETSLRQEIGNC